MEINKLKQRVIEEIDKNRDKIINLGRDIYSEPELGYEEVNTTKKVSKVFKELGCNVEENIAVTGCRARIGSSNGPRLAIMGELDCIRCYGHKDAKNGGKIHGCGHNIQVAGLIGSAIGLINSGALKELNANVDFMATPSEEFIEIEFREKLRKQGKIEFFGGKQELIKKGYFDDVDMAMMFHALDLGENTGQIGTVSNGFMGKRVKFIGRESHAGSAPENGVNALNAAMLAMNNIHAQRETFKEEDKVRVHYILTKGGDIVNVIPSEVVMECYVRARNIEAIVNTNKKVDRAIRAGALAVGATVEIVDIPGYLPILNYKELDNIYKNNLEELGYKGKIVETSDFTGSFDFGDLSQIMPTLHPMMGGISGSLHSSDYKIVNEDNAYLIPAKAMAMTAIDLLYNHNENMKDILKEFKAPMSKDEYLNYLRSIRKEKVYTE
ncbi:amidohydrolase [Hathewaya histolytica]|uniref:Peptidase M20 domain-containing protein 2 n=1 Tax=Hathewaya histolytica TaxID=1498 RepID=A0A4U9QWC7_HATHI|nr:amidohydrolase [Hathewaya histolytica]VTQ82091.1 amidohydrolase [Hathewaya histolytica]